MKIEYIIWIPAFCMIALLGIFVVDSLIAHQYVLEDCKNKGFNYYSWSNEKVGGVYKCYNFDETSETGIVYSKYYLYEGGLLI